MSGGLNRRQAFASHAAAIGKRGFAALARIAVKKSVLPFAADFRRLILAFHKLIRLPSGRKTGACEDSHETPRVKTQLIAWNYCWSCPFASYRLDLIIGGEFIGIETCQPQFCAAKTMNSDLPLP
jgi:hypothetical protein